MPNPEGKPMPSLTFAHIDSIALDVASIDIYGQAGPAAESFVVSPFTAAQRYFLERFSAGGGGQGRLVINIEEASVVHRQAASANTFVKLLDVAGEDVYDIKITVRFERLSPQGHVAYGKVLKAGRKIKVTEHASIAQRERRQLQGMEILFRDIDTHVREIVFKEMKLAPRPYLTR